MFQSCPDIPGHNGRPTARTIRSLSSSFHPVSQCRRNPPAGRRCHHPTPGAGRGKGLPRPTRQQIQQPHASSSSSAEWAMHREKVQSWWGGATRGWKLLSHASSSYDSKIYLVLFRPHLRDTSTTRWAMSRLKATIWLPWLPLWKNGSQRFLSTYASPLRCSSHNLGSRL